jgi:putative ABC transport system permease protein
MPIPQMQAIVRVHGDPATMLSAVQGAIREADPQIALVHVKTLESLASETLWQRRLWGILTSLFAGLALLLAIVGLYGVMSYLVSLRTRELGIRMALGARRSNVLTLVIRHGIALTLAGALIGLAGALAVGRLMQGLLFGVSALDPGTLFAAPLVLLLAALAACAVPAVRAARVDPLAALRKD